MSKSIILNKNINPQQRYKNTNIKTRKIYFANCGFWKFS